MQLSTLWTELSRHSNGTIVLQLQLFATLAVVDDVALSFGRSAFHANGRIARCGWLQT